MTDRLTVADIVWWEDVLDCWEATGIITEKEWLDSMTRFLNTFDNEVEAWPKKK